MTGQHEPHTIEISSSSDSQSPPSRAATSADSRSSVALVHDQTADVVDQLGGRGPKYRLVGEEPAHQRAAPTPEVVAARYRDPDQFADHRHRQRERVPGEQLDRLTRSDRAGQLVEQLGRDLADPRSQPLDPARQNSALTNRRSRAWLSSLVFSMCVVRAGDSSGARRSMAMLLGDNTRVSLGSPNSARTCACDPASVGPRRGGGGVRSGGRAVRR